jgi:hypothetical protein
MNMRLALAQSPVKQAMRDEGDGLRITVTRQASEYYEVVVTMGETIHLSETVVDEQAVELLLWERLRMQSILFEPVQVLPSAALEQALHPLSVAEQIATEHQFGNLLNSYIKRRANVALTWIGLGLGFLVFVIVGRYLLDDTATVGGKVFVAFFGLSFSFLLLYASYVTLLSNIRINELLQEIKDKTLGNYHTILLYEHGLICCEWIERKGTWKNNLTVVPWTAIRHLKSSSSIPSQGTVDTFTIRTRDGHSVDISMGGQALMNAIEKQMKATA